MAYGPGSHAGPFAVGMSADDTAADGQREFADLIDGGGVLAIGDSTALPRPRRRHGAEPTGLGSQRNTSVSERLDSHA